MKRKIYSVLGVAFCGILMAAGTMSSDSFDVESSLNTIQANEPISFTIDGRNTTTTTTTTSSTTTTTTTTRGKQ